MRNRENYEQEMKGREYIRKREAAHRGQAEEVTRKSRFLLQPLALSVTEQHSPMVRQEDLACRRSPRKRNKQKNSHIPSRH